MAARITPLSVEINLGKQYVAYREIIKFGEHKLLIAIVSDSYDFQSRATVSVLQKDEVKWETLDTIHYSNMKTRPGLYVYPEYKTPENRAQLKGKLAFVNDRDALVAKVKLLLA